MTSPSSPVSSADGTVPKDAAAVILLRSNTDPANPEVFLVRRGHQLAFLGGFYAFPGGQLEPSDQHARVENCNDPVIATMISCAARELFEELRVLVVRGGDVLTQGQRASLLDDLESGRMSWPVLLEHYGLHLDASDFMFAGRWVTPPFSPRRFDTWFFLVRCPPRQEPIITGGEHESGEWANAVAAYEKWQRSDLLAAPPVIHGLRTLGGGIGPDLIDRFLSIREAHREPPRSIEFRPNYICFPVLTPTKPPATHTNCYLILTSEEILIVDPGSPYEEEQKALAECVDNLCSEGRTVREIVLTHRHPDHVAGVNSLSSTRGIPVSAHRLTAEALHGTIAIDRLLEDGDVITLRGAPEIKLRVIHTPGHARGHVCLYEERTGTLLSGDNIVGLGSVLIDPPEGNMRAYLDSLLRMRSLPNLSVMFGGHGPAIGNPHYKIDEYIAHRLDREQNILRAVGEGASKPEAIVGRVYTDVSPRAHAMAERAVIAHLEKLEEDNLVRRVADGWLAVSSA